jgi:hypothetical protein
MRVSDEGWAQGRYFYEFRTENIYVVAETEITVSFLRLFRHAPILQGRVPHPLPPCRIVELIPTAHAYPSHWLQDNLAKVPFFVEWLTVRIGVGGFKR